MKNDTLIFPQITTKEEPKRESNFFYILAFAGVFGGVLSIFTGFIFTIVHSVLKGDVTFDRIGTVLMIIAIPLMLLGGHFMDKATEKKK